MTTLKTLLLLTLLVAALSPTHGEIYKIVDESGRVTFTDTPPIGAETSDTKVQLSKPNTQQSIPVPEKKPQPADDGTSVEKYQFIRIVQPSNNTTIPPGQTDVVVQIASQPLLQSGHLLQVLYDGKPVAPPAETSSVTIRELYRGAHQIKAQIIDDKRRVLIESDAITIYVKRTTKLIKPQ